jgi:hypothetical protein
MHSLPYQNGAMGEALTAKIASAVTEFAWLDRFGETSYERESFFASKLRRSAKALYNRQAIC